MNNLNQIKLIKKYLLSLKEKFFGELKKLDNMITRKINAIEKLRSYRQEYSNSNVLELTRVTPLLQRNLYNFVQELGDLIQRDENELHKLSQAKNSLRMKCEKIKNQLDFICEREKKVQKTLLAEEEKATQKTADEFISNHYVRNAHD